MATETELNEAFEDAQEPKAEALKKESKIVSVVELFDQADGKTKGLGNTLDMPLDEAMKLVEEHKALALVGNQTFSTGVVPDEWK